MSSVKQREVQWLWKDRFPLGNVSILAGPQGVGKSSLATEMAAAVTNHNRWPDGGESPNGDAMMLIAEDSLESTVGPRLSVHEADLKRCHVLTGIDAGDAGQDWVTFADMDVIENALADHPQTKLLVVDPVGSFISSRVDLNRENDVRTALSPLKEIAERFSLAVVLVCHHKKPQGNRTGSADDQIMGSRAFSALARVTWHVLADPDDQQRRLLVSGKNNLAKPPAGLAFRLEDQGGVAAINWQSDRIDQTADQILASINRTAMPRDRAGERTAALLQDFLVSPKSKEEVEQFAKAEGISDRQLRKASSMIGVTKVPAGFGEPWRWSLPEEPDREKEDQSRTQAPNSENRTKLYQTERDCLQTTF